MELKVKAELDADFAPMSVFCREFIKRVDRDGGRSLVIGIERNNGYISAYRTKVFEDNTGHDEENYVYAERIVKTLLWAKGGYKIIIAGSSAIADRIAADYSPDGKRRFDAEFMSRVYERPFCVEKRHIDDAPETFEKSEAVGRHLDGCRIGFDAGGSDRKVSAVVDGKTVYSEEVIWHPKTNSDPAYHYQGILEAMKTAASKMPRVDAIGVSSAGVYIDNRIMVASLFVKVGDEDFEKSVKNMYIDVAKQIGDVPVCVANDGDVTALAGAMELDDTDILGIAMGTSEAGGYVDGAGNITGWLNELAFIPVDLNPEAAVDEWSGDVGCGVKYFSQDAVIRLAPVSGIELDRDMTPAEKLRAVQELMLRNDPRAEKIFRTIGVYLGYELAYYAQFYNIKHVLLMGRVTSGSGGTLILEKAQQVLEEEFPVLSRTIVLHIPDENSRRVGQSIAAASLPEIR